MLWEILIEPVNEDVDFHHYKQLCYEGVYAPEAVWCVYSRAQRVCWKVLVCVDNSQLPSS